MDKINIKMNNIVEIKEGKDYYRCIVQDVKENGFIVNLPVKDGVYLTLNKGDTVKGCCYIEDIGYFQFTSEILERVRNLQMPCYKLASPTEIKKINRRNFVRVELAEKVEYTLKGENKIRNCFLLDISGGGARIRTEDKLKVGDIIFIDLQDDIGVIEAVVRRNIGVNSKDLVYGLEFKILNERIRDKIVNKVFLEMRKQRGKNI